MGPIWRLRVGNAPLDASALLFCGGGEVVGTSPGAFRTSLFLKSMATAP